MQTHTGRAVGCLGCRSRHVEIAHWEGACPRNGLGMPCRAGAAPGSCRACTRASVPVAMNRWVARRSCGEIFTFISLSESLKMEKSWGLRPRWGTRSFFRLSAAGRAERSHACSSHKAAAAGPHGTCTRIDRHVLLHPMAGLLWRSRWSSGAHKPCCASSLGSSSLGSEQDRETHLFLRNKSWVVLAASRVANELGNHP